jgi:hypothetical protein
MQKKLSWPNFKVHLPGGTEESHENLNKIGLRAKIWARDLLNTKQEC